MSGELPTGTHLQGAGTAPVPSACITHGGECKGSLGPRSLLLPGAWRSCKMQTFSRKKVPVTTSIHWAESGNDLLLLSGGTEG
jgi:hypothetical protein